MPPLRTEYVCPVCSEKTILINTMAWKSKSLSESDIEALGFDYFISNTFEFLENCHEEIKQLNALGLDATLDERSLCEGCRAKMEPVPEFGDFFVEVKVGKKTTRTKIEWNDFCKLIAFLEEKDTWNADAGGDRPLKDELPRIREILGMPEASEKKNHE